MILRDSILRFLPGNRRRSIFPVWAIFTFKTLLVASSSALAATPQGGSLKYPDIWGATIGVPPDIPILIGAAKPTAGDVVLFFALSRFHGDTEVTKVLSFNFFSQTLEVIAEKSSSDVSAQAAFFKYYNEQLHRKFALCCDSVIPPSSLYYTFVSSDGDTEIAVESGICLMCDYFVLRRGDIILGRQIIRFLKSPIKYHWMEAKPHVVTYDSQTIPVLPTNIIPLDDGTFIVFTDQGVIFRMNKNFDSKYFRQNDVIKIDYDISQQDAALPQIGLQIGERFPHADSRIETNCAFSQLYQTYNKIRSDERKESWKFRNLGNCR